MERVPACTCIRAVPVNNFEYFRKKHGASGWQRWRLSAQPSAFRWHSFLLQGRLVELTAEQQEMFAAWSTLTKPQKEALQQLILVMKEPI